MADRIVFNEAELAALFRSLNGPIAKDLARRVIRVDRAAKKGCPVDTGRLRSSITDELAMDDEGLVGRVGTDVEYAPYVELGTSRMAAQPFLRPALAAAGDAQP